MAGANHEAEHRAIAVCLGALEVGGLGEKPLKEVLEYCRRCKEELVQRQHSLGLDERWLP